MTATLRELFDLPELSHVLPGFLASVSTPVIAVELSVTPPKQFRAGTLYCIPWQKSFYDPALDNLIRRAYRDQVAALMLVRPLATDTHQKNVNRLAGAAAKAVSVDDFVNQAEQLLGGELQWNAQPSANVPSTAAVVNGSVVGHLNHSSGSQASEILRLSDSLQLNTSVVSRGIMRAIRHSSYKISRGSEARRWRNSGSMRSSAPCCSTMF